VELTMVAQTVYVKRRIPSRSAFMTFLIHRAEREQAWQMFDHYYRLPDKGEMQLRIKAILKDQPVYNFIYNNVISSSQTKTCRS